MRGWGQLDGKYEYVKSDFVSRRRGFAKARGGGPDGMPLPSDIASRAEVMKSGLWAWLAFYMDYDMQTTMFQPVGGMDMIGKAFGRQVKRSRHPQYPGEPHRAGRRGRDGDLQGQ